MISEDTPSKCTKNVFYWIVWMLFHMMFWNHQFDIFSFVMMATRGPKLGLRRPKVNQFWTLTQQMHTPDLVGNPGRIHGRREARTLTISVPSRLCRRGQYWHGTRRGCFCALCSMTSWGMYLRMRNFLQHDRLQCWQGVLYKHIQMLQPGLPLHWIQIVPCALVLCFAVLS